MFKSGYSSSSLNSARSALSFFCHSDNLANDPYLTRLFKYFYRVRPKRAKYIVYWPVSQLLEFLETLHPPSSLSLKDLTLKTSALIALSSSDRGQTLHLMNINRYHLSSQQLSFVITERLKTTKRTLKPKVVNCVASDKPALSPYLYVQEYISRTAPLRRPEHDQLFISWATKRPVTRVTLARWLKSVLLSAGIDTKIFSAHSYRGASLSSAFAKGVSITDIISAGDWANSTTFFNHYLAPSSNSSVGQIILSQTPQPGMLKFK